MINMDIFYFLFEKVFRRKKEALLKEKAKEQGIDPKEILKDEKADKNENNEPETKSDKQETASKEETNEKKDEKNQSKDGDGKDKDDSDTKGNVKQEEDKSDSESKSNESNSEENTAYKKPADEPKKEESASASSGSADGEKIHEVEEELRSLKGDITKRLGEFDERIGKLNTTLSGVQGPPEGFDEKLQNLEDELEKFKLLLYELSTNTVNPFIEEKANSAPSSETSQVQPPPHAPVVQPKKASIAPASNDTGQETIAPEETKDSSQFFPESNETNEESSVGDKQEMADSENKEAQNSEMKAASKDDIAKIIAKHKEEEKEKDQEHKPELDQEAQQESGKGEQSGEDTDSSPDKKGDIKKDDPEKSYVAKEKEIISESDVSEEKAIEDENEKDSDTSAKELSSDKVDKLNAVLEGQLNTLLKKDEEPQKSKDESQLNEKSEAKTEKDEGSGTVTKDNIADIIAKAKAKKEEKQTRQSTMPEPGQEKKDNAAHDDDQEEPEGQTEQTEKSDKTDLNDIKQGSEDSENEIVLDDTQQEERIEVEDKLSESKEIDRPDKLKIDIIESISNQSESVDIGGHEITDQAVSPKTGQVLDQEPIELIKEKEEDKQADQKSSKVSSQEEEQKSSEKKPEFQGLEQEKAREKVKEIAQRLISDAEQGDSPILKEEQIKKLEESILNDIMKKLQDIKPDLAASQEKEETKSSKEVIKNRASDKPAQTGKKTQQEEMLAMRKAQKSTGEQNSEKDKVDNSAGEAHAKRDILAGASSKDESQEVALQPDKTSTKQSRRAKSSKKIKGKKRRSKKSKMTYPPIPAEKYFRLSNGGVIRNLNELVFVTDSMDDETFAEHVNQNRNDFYNWIIGVFNETTLAGKLKNVYDRKTFHRILEDYLFNS